jgi:hypothetical protein
MRTYELYREVVLSPASKGSTFVTLVFEEKSGSFPPVRREKSFAHLSAGHKLR